MKFNSGNLYTEFAKRCVKRGLVPPTVEDERCRVKIAKEAYEMSKTPIPMSWTDNKRNKPIHWFTWPTDTQALRYI